MISLMDTGFILALLSTSDKHHERCVPFATPDALVPSAVLPELAYLLIRQEGYTSLIRFMRSLLNNPSRFVTMTVEDLERTADLMEKYADIRIDFVDCAIVAVAERLNITRILTVDQRDFRILRPKHISAFEILP